MVGPRSFCAQGPFVQLAYDMQPQHTCATGQGLGLSSHAPARIPLSTSWACPERGANGATCNARSCHSARPAHHATWRPESDRCAQVCAQSLSWGCAVEAAAARDKLAAMATSASTSAKDRRVLPRAYPDLLIAADVSYQHDQTGGSGSNWAILLETILEVSDQV